MNFRVFVTTGAALAALTLLLGPAQEIQAQGKGKGGKAAPAAKAKAAAKADQPPELHVLPVQGNIYMLVGAGAHIAMSIGPDGVMLIDSGKEEYADYVAKEALELASMVTATPMPNQCRGMRCPGSPFGWSSPALNAHITVPARAKPIRYIINTSADPDHYGGNARLSQLPKDSPIVGVTFPPVGLAPSANILAHENVLIRMSELVDPSGKSEETKVPDADWPTLTYREPKYKLSEFFNGEGVELLHAPNAHTDGDTMVYFRYSDVIVAGEILDNTHFPMFDIERGGSIDGELNALNMILDLAISEFRSQGGTLIIPGHGRLMDNGDLANYRNMVAIIRDRVKDGIERGLTLEQVKAEKPSFDYDGIYSKPDWTGEKFVEAVYKSLKEPPPAE